jgi:predicted phage terminase large subunit-like protein
MDRAAEWLRNTDAHWDGQTHTWRFPAGSTLTFGYCDSESDVYRYQGAGFQYIGVDELTQFTERQYTYLFSRLSRLAGVTIPLRMRSASNPGGEGHEWVKERFIVGGAAGGRVVIRAAMEDNPYVDAVAIDGALQELDPITRAQLRDGDWDVSSTGSLFHREWFARCFVDALPAGLRLIRVWDLAATEKASGRRSGDPDWTVGTLMGLLAGRWYIADVRRVRATPYNVERLVRSTAELDGKGVSIWIEEEGGASGKSLLDAWRRTLLPGWDVRSYRPTLPKPVRARPVSSAVEAGNVMLLRAPWNALLLDELEFFPQGAHDDIVDTLSAGVDILTPKHEGKAGTVRYA